MKETQLQQLVNKELSKIDKNIQNCLRGRKIDKDYQTMFLCDISDYIKYYKLISDGEFKEASKFQWQMDTAVRDGIPDYIYRFIDNQ